MARLRSLVLALALTVTACAGTDRADSEVSGAEPVPSTTAATQIETAAPAEPVATTVATVPPLERRPLPDDFDERVSTFLERPVSLVGTDLALDMARTGDPRWVPWLLDMFRLDVADTSVALPSLTGIAATGNAVKDLLAWGTWMYAEEPDTGPGYRDFKSTLYARIDPQFEGLISSVEDDLVLSRIMYGGVRRGGIPELNDPERVTVAKADWMVDDELVLAAEVDGEAVAYPIRIIGHHELINDTVGGRPVSMVFCTLCRTGLLFDRNVDGQVLDFQTSGLLINSNKIMVDSPTDTLWHHLTGVGIGGPLAGTKLDQLPVVTTTWADWIAEHPDTTVPVLPDPIFFPETPERPPIAYDYTPGAAYSFYYEQEELLFPALPVSDVFADKTEIIGLASGDDSLALELARLEPDTPRTFVVGGRPFLVIPTTAGVRVYDATVAGYEEGPVSTAVIAAAGEEFAEVTPGIALPRVVAEQGFWFAWSANHPSTRTWPS